MCPLAPIEQPPGGSRVTQTFFLHSESLWFGLFFFFFRGSRGEIGIGEVSSVQFSHSVQRCPERLELLILKDVSTEGIVAPSFRRDEERMNNSGFTLSRLPAPSLSISLLLTFLCLHLRLYNFVSNLLV